MCSAIPPAPPPVAPSVQASAPVVLSVAADSAAADMVLRLPSGSLVTASVIATEGQGAVRVLTADGAMLSLKLPPGQSALPDGAQLSLQTMMAQNGRPAMKLLAVNGRSVGAPTVQLPQMPGLLPGTAGFEPQSADMIAGRSAAAGRPADLSRGNAASAVPAVPAESAGLTATVLRPAAAGAGEGGRATPSGLPGLPESGAAPPGFADLPPGTRLTVRIAAFTPPVATDVAAGPPLPALGPVPGQPLIPAAVHPGSLPPSSPGAALPSPSAAPAAPGFPAVPAAIASPTGLTPLPAAPSPYPVMPGVVVAQAMGGTVQVQSPAGLLSLSLDTPLPVGGEMRLEVIGLPLPPLSRPPAPPPQGLTPAGWPTLDQAVDTLMASDRQAADILMRVIPQAGPRLAATLSQFAGAVRSGDFGKVAGEPVTRGLEKAGRKDLAERLKRDFMDLSEEASRPAGKAGEWQAITMPFAHGADIDPITLFVHRPREDEEGGAKGGNEQRFLLEVRMSVLGRLQLDGLVQKENRRFDLIVRTAEPLAPVMCRDIAGIFAECGQLTGITGQVSFQAGRSFIDLPPAGPSATRIVV